MPSPEQFYQPHPSEAPQPTTSPQMEQVVTRLAALHHVDLSQKGATLTLDVPEQKQQWLITNWDDRIGVTRLKVDKEKAVAPDLDIVLEKKPEGWEPVEVVHTEAAWQDYMKIAQAVDQTVTDAQNNFDFVRFSDYMAKELSEQGGLEQAQHADEQVQSSGENSNPPLEASEATSPIEIHDVNDFLRKWANEQVMNNPSFEIDLLDLGLLKRLEQEGVVPLVESPNPHRSVGTQRQAHDEWWQEHPAEHEAYEQAQWQRKQVLRGLYYGMMLHSFYGDAVLFPNSQGREQLRAFFRSEEIWPGADK